jgi:tetratricopeptide (TPR) repeat protein
VQTAQQAGNAAGMLTAINNVLENFADTEFKPMLFAMALGAAQQLGDDAQVVTWAERITGIDPNDIESRVTVAETTAQHMRENDLDKSDNIKKVNELAHKALDLIQSGGTMPSGIPEEKAAEYKKQTAGRAWAAMGLAQTVDKKYPDAITDYKKALEAYPNSIITARLAKAYLDSKQYDDAIATADKALAMPDASPQVKNFAQAQKDAATKMKGPH